MMFNGKARVPVILLGMTLLLLPLQAESDALFSRPGGKISFSTTMEMGFFGFISHTIQFGDPGTAFDYVADGGQEVLFPFKRLSADITFGNRHTITFLIQPIDVRTSVTNGEEIIVDGETFPSGIPLDLRYGFDFYRLSYLYDFFPSPQKELSVGASLQLRDAVIDFAAADGSAFTGNRNVGPVPILKFRFVHPLGNLFWVGAEVDGIYVSFKVLNGSLTSDTTGAILDASLRAGMKPSNFLDVFLNLRYLGGGAEGSSGAGYTKNFLHSYSVSLGGRLY